ncbi:hypothetical protein ACH5AL_31580 [Actinacidiphila glaucinigra]|uniref:hypothetical protein n=1 Tax=Actinacidiphila glaucinigra TaxID=235986 RepID=UPI00378E41CE
MLTQTANEDSRLSFWLRVREFAVPPSMVETATARRRTGDWAGACAAAGIDVDLDLRSLARTHGRELATRVRADLRHLAPDLLRWHMPRVAPDGLLRPALTIALARYGASAPEGGDRVHLVVRTPPAWADGGQRFSLALWDPARPGTGARHHPHHRPHRRFRLDLHRHLWDARRTGELPFRAGTGGRRPVDPPLLPDPEPTGPLPPHQRCAVDRWEDEARMVLRAEGRTSGTVTVRLGSRHRLLVDVTGADHGAGGPTARITEATGAGGGNWSLPVLPDAATWVPPDVELLAAGLIAADGLHPLVAAALVPGHPPSGPSLPRGGPGRPRVVECRGAPHRIGLVDGVLTALDHEPEEIRREELLVALTGTPLPCLQAIDRAHRRPESLSDVRARLDHGDIAGALAVVEGLLGPGAVLRDGPLRDELEAAAQRRIAYGLFRAGLAGPAPGRVPPRAYPPALRTRPRRGRPDPRYRTAR